MIGWLRRVLRLGRYRPEADAGLQALHREINRNERLRATGNPYGDGLGDRERGRRRPGAEGAP